MSASSPSPETKGLSAVLPEGFKVRKVWLEEEICYVSLSSALLEGQPEPETLSQAVLALEQSLLSLESVEEVRFLVDGELADTYGFLDAQDPDALLLVETWQTPEDQQRHCGTETFAKLQALKTEFCDTVTIDKFDY